MNQTQPGRRLVRILQEFSIPLIAGIVVALIVANIAPDQYHAVVHETPLSVFSDEFSQTTHDTGDTHTAEQTHAGHASDVASHVDASSDSALAHATVENSSHWYGTLGHIFTMHFLINDLFMVLFFGVAAKEITESCLPGGSLNPVSKAINPLMGTLGGVVGPVAVFLGLNMLFGQADWARGWGIPTATDIALAWLAARFIFGAGHPAVSFLLLLAVADDAIGLGIIAIAYPDPNHPTLWANAAWIVPGMLSALLMRRFRVMSWLPYVVVGGGLCWWGLYSAHLHPALALVFIVPFMPGPQSDHGLFLEEADWNAQPSHSPLEQFEHSLKGFVDFGLFFFAFANAGVSLGGINELTWITLGALLIGKTLGITLFSGVAALCGCKLPDGMNLRHLIVAGLIAGIGLTVALFVSGQAFADPASQGPAKMGALLSIFGFAVAAVAARMLGIRPIDSALESKSVQVSSSQTSGDELAVEPRSNQLA